MLVSMSCFAPVSYSANFYFIFCIIVNVNVSVIVECLQLNT